MYNLDAIIIEEAQQAFFGILAKRYKLRTGDLDLLSDIEFTTACRKVARSYITQNKKLDD